MSNILLITEVPFWYRSKGNQQRIASMVEYLKLYHSVDIFFIGLDKVPAITGLNFSRVIPYSGLSYIAHKILHIMPYKLRNKLVGVLNKKNYTRTLDSFRSEKVSSVLKRQLSKKIYNTVIIEYVWNAYLTDEIDRSQSTVLLDTHDIFYQRVESYAEYGKVPDKTITRQQELSEFKKFDYLIAIQQKEYQFLNKMFAEKAILSMHPQEIDEKLYLRRLKHYKSGETIQIAYFAAYADMNIDAISWFINSVWNSELTEHFRLNIYGSICEGLKFHQEGVNIIGRVDKISDVYCNSDIVINPQRFGSGLKIKSVEALSHGMPLISTSIGAQGLEFESTYVFIIADHPEEFREKLYLLKDKEQRRIQSIKALEFARNHLSPDACYNDLNRKITNSIKI